MALGPLSGWTQWFGLSSLKQDLTQFLNTSKESALVLALAVRQRGNPTDLAPALQILGFLGPWKAPLSLI